MDQNLDKDYHKYSAYYILGRNGFILCSNLSLGQAKVRWKSWSLCAPEMGVNTRLECYVMLLNKAKTDEEYDTITEEGKTITDPDETKQYIANFYENLYQARKGSTEYQKWTDHITQEIKNIETTMENQSEPDFETKEIKKCDTKPKKWQSPRTGWYT